MKLVIKKYIFFIVLSLLAFISGLSFILLPSKSGNYPRYSDADHTFMTVTFNAYWKNSPESTAYKGAYKTATSGMSILGEVATLNILENTITLLYDGEENHDFDETISWEGAFSNTTYDESSSVVKCKVDMPSIIRNLFLANCKVTFNWEVKSGFMIYDKPNGIGMNFFNYSLNKSHNYDFDIYVIPQTYTTTYYANGGQFSDNSTYKSTQTVFYEFYTMPDQNPSFTGYSFQGWSKDAYAESDSYDIYDFSSLEDTSEVNLYARYRANQYKITFDKQSGTGGTSSTTATYDSTCPSINIPTMTGYKFMGYYTGVNGSGIKYYTADGAGLRYYTIANDATLYAYWQKETYNFVFNANGGTCSTSSRSVTYGTSYTFPTPTRTGYKFGGWKYNSTLYSGTKTIGDFGNDGANINFVAQWTIEKYNVKYYHDTTDILKGSTTVTYGDSLELPFPTKVGYDFVNWKYRDTGGNVSSRGNTYSGTITVPDWGTNDCDVPLEAQWVKETYTINFDANGGSAASAITATFGDTYTSTSTQKWPTSTRTGYIFDGWTYEGVTYKDSFTVFDFGGEDSKNEVVSVTFVASWTPITYTIRLHANNGTNDYVDVAMTYDISKSLPNNTFTKANYVFQGWSTTIGGSVTYNNQQSMLNLLSTQGEVYHLYGVWKETWAEHYAVPQGKGTVTEPYLISKAEELAWMSRYTENTGALTGYFVQTTNIDLAGYEWLSIGNSANTFNGNFYGNGYMIKNITITRATNVARNYVGLFGYTVGAKISEVRLTGTIEAANYVGGIVGYATKSNISNSTNFATIKSISLGGGISGYAKESEIISCINNAQITGGSGVFNNNFGGISGYILTTKVLNCFSKANISGMFNVGGIAGGADSSSSLIESCGFEGSVTSTTSITTYAKRVGAIVGHTGTSKVILKNCYAKAIVGSITDNNKGLGYGNVSNCIFETNAIKKYRGTDFSAWIITADNRVLPSGLSWLATGGVKVTSTSQIEALGYTKV